MSTGIDLPRLLSLARTVGRPFVRLLPSPLQLSCEKGAKWEGVLLCTFRVRFWSNAAGDIQLGIMSHRYAPGTVDSLIISRAASALGI